MESILETTDIRLVEIEKKDLINQIEKLIERVNEIEKENEYNIQGTTFKNGYKLVAVRSYKNIDIENILKKCCETAYEIDDICAQVRKKQYVFARVTFAFIYKRIISRAVPLKHIGNILGGLDHSTIVHGLETFRKEYETNELFRIKFDHVCKLLEHKGVYIEIENKI